MAKLTSYYYTFLNKNARQSSISNTENHFTSLLLPIWNYYFTLNQSGHNALFYLFYEFKLFKQCCFPSNLAGHTCKYRYKHAEYGTAITWDDALQSSIRPFEHKSYNIFTCNCHSFVASCLNRLCYGGSMDWNMVNVAALILFEGRWVSWISVLKAFLPFVVVGCLGVIVVGWPFLIGLLSFSLLLMGWFLVANYCVKSVLEC